MKKFVIKTFLLIFSCISLFAGFSYAATIAFNEVGYSNSCSTYQGETKYFNYYLTNGTYTQNPYDTFTASGHDAIQILNNGSTAVTYVGLWRGDGFVSGCNDWRSSSTIAKVGVSGTLVLFNNNGCTFKKPSNTYVKTSSTSIDAQIQFTIGYVSKGVSNQLTLPAGQKLYYKTPGQDLRTCYEGNNQVSDWNQCTPSPAYPISYVRQHTGECINYRIFRCGDGLLNGYNGSTSYNNGTYTEQCDPNDPNHSGRGNGGCSASCQPINVQNPQCSSSYNNQTQYTPNGDNWLNQNMNLCTIGSVTNFQFSWNPGHSRHFTWNCTAGGNSTDCLAYQQWCGDGKVESNHGEACDPNDPTHAGWNGNGYTCNNQCQLVPPPIQAPQCSSTYNNQTQYTPNGNNWLNQNMNLCTIGSVTNFQFSWNPGHSRHFTWNCNNDGQSTGCLAYQQWCGDGKVESNHGEACDPADPTQAGRGNGGCSASCQPINPGSPVPYLLKQQKTGGMSNFTSNQINVQIGETITYKVNFGNSGTVAATGEVWDILPPCVNYLTSSIHLPNGVTYNGPITTPYLDQTMVKYKDFRLQPGQGGYMLIQAQIRGTGTHGTTSCQNITSYLNTGYFKFVGGNTLSSQVIAVRPQAPQLPHLTIVKELLTTGNVSVGDYVGYKITLRNIGSGMAYNAYILDTMPRALQYISSNIQGVTNYLFSGWMDTNGQYNVKYYNFNLAPNQSAVVYLTGRLLDGYSFGDLTNCASTSGAVDCVIISGSPVPYLLKQQKTGGMSNFTSNQINVQIGETITYKVNFGNSGTVAATGEVWDILPPCVNYLTSSIHLPNGVTYNGPITTPYLDQTMVKYKDFRLQPGQGGYMLIQAQIRGTGAHGTTSCQNITSYLNTGYFKFIGGNTLSSQVIAVRPESSSNVIFDKTGNKNLMYPGETGLEFYITVTNQGPNPISNIYVDDIWPDNETCIIYDGWTGTKLEEVSHLRRHYIGGDAGLNQGTLNGRVSDKGGADDGKTNVGNGGGAGTNSQQTSNGILYAGQSFNFTIFAHVADNPSCVGSYVNTGKLTYTEGGSSHVLYDDYPFQVITTPNIKVSIVKTVDHQYVNHNDTVTYTITYTNNGTAPLTNYVIKDYWPAMVEFISSTPYTNDIVVDGNGTLITWHFSTPLGVGESATITAVGRVR